MLLQSTLKCQNRSMGPQLISANFKTFERHDYAYIIYDMQTNNMTIPSHLVIDTNKEKNTIWGYQTEMSGDNDRQIMTVEAHWHDVSSKQKIRNWTKI